MATDIFTVTPLEIGIDAPAAARELMRSATGDVHDEAACADAILLVSQLVTDVALCGSAQRLGLTIRITDDVLWAGVETTGAPDAPDPGHGRIRHVQMLDLLASQWGVVGGGADGADDELTWFEIWLDGSAG